MLDLFIDIGHCPVYQQVLRAAQRHALELYAVTCDYVELDGDVHLILAHADDAGGRDWIAGNIRRGDICVTDDPKLASGCLRRGAFALTSAGRAWTGELVAAREISVTAASGMQLPSRQGAIDTRHFAHRLDVTIAEARAIPRRRTVRSGDHDAVLTISP
jgi:uncharacterized protein